MTYYPQSTQFSELQNSNMLGTAAVLLATSHFLPGTVSEKPRKASENLAYGGGENQIKPLFFGGARVSIVWVF